MATEGEYVPSAWDWVREQVEKFEASDGTEGNTLLDTGMPIIVVTMKGVKTGAVRKVPLMRVEYNGEYALIGSQGGAPKNPGWVYNLRNDPHVTIQDGPEKAAYVVTELPEGDEREQWWQRSVAAYPPYAEYQERTERRIPVFVATRV